MDAKSHHYVPQHYLRGFTCDENSEQIVVFDLELSKNHRTNVSKTARQNYYYSFTEESGAKNIDGVERGLNNDIENPAIPIINFIRMRKNITIKQRETLAAYIDVMRTRVPRHRERVRSSLPDFLPKEHSAQKRKLIEAYRDDQITKSELDTRTEILDQVFAEMESNPPKQLLLPYVGNVKDHLAKMNWTFLCRETSPFFLTSDNPFVFTERHGLKPPDGQVIFPVSSKILLWLTWQASSEVQYEGASENGVNELNRYIAGNATRFLFFHEYSEYFAKIAEDEKHRRHRATY